MENNHNFEEYIEALRALSKESNSKNYLGLEDEGQRKLETLKILATEIFPKTPSTSEVLPDLAWTVLHNQLRAVLRQSREKKVFQSFIERIIPKYFFNKVKKNKGTKRYTIKFSQRSLKGHGNGADYVKGFTSSSAHKTFEEFREASEKATLDMRKLNKAAEFQKYCGVIFYQKDSVDHTLYAGSTRRMAQHVIMDTTPETFLIAPLNGAYNKRHGTPANGDWEKATAKGSLWKIGKMPKDTKRTQKDFSNTANFDSVKNGLFVVYDVTDKKIHGAYDVTGFTVKEAVLKKCSQLL